jgi:hypothetical protein
MLKYAFDNGTTVRVKNRLGASATVKLFTILCGEKIMALTLPMLARVKEMFYDNVDTELQDSLLEHYELSDYSGYIPFSGILCISTLTSGSYQCPTPTNFLLRDSYPMDADDEADVEILVQYIQHSLS